MRHLLTVAGFVLVPLLGSAADFIETVDGVRFVMKEIPAGEFLMGPSALDNFGSEVTDATGQHQGPPQHVAVDSFYMAETETTWALYQLAIAEGACADNQADGGDNGWGKGQRPVIEVSWDEVTQHFLPWLNAKTGKTYRLPTEAEWEYAARAGSNQRYHWGNDIDCSRARYGHTAQLCPGPAGTKPVKSYAPNDFGLYDMHGNVWEMTATCWDNHEHDDEYCRDFVLRGGSWQNNETELHVAFRARHDRSFRESGDGFRLVLSK